ncbi:MAG: prephenate dehydrogenase/arogenate dehydrogenase family protein [Clostridia bacterium]|nr:prephenate dehydrogenase/arogenate dehydrogenase family protein [Clostridia bacterium]
MNVGIVGLGLIGGSMAKAIKETNEHTVYGYDILESTMLASQLVGAVDGTLDSETLPTCDIVIVSLYPQATVDYITQNADRFKKDCVVIDCSGVKRHVCDRINPLAKNHQFTFIGGHPMAGTQFWGFDYSRASLFKGASMILTPHGISDIALLDKVKKFFTSFGFADITFSTPDDHDRIIAYTSQLAHIVSNAYVKSPTALNRKGFSAGSYKDMTRVAKLNEKMWTELFLENNDYLVNEIDILIENLQQYRDALKNADGEALSALLKEGKDTKKQAG